MTTDEIREKYLKFFEGKGHKRIASAPLVLENDPTTLFTSSGMQPLVPYLKGEPHPEGKRLVNSQPSLRLEDIDEVGDTRHTTFFEMLGNWSLGDYFKKEQLSWFWEFLMKELGLPKEKLYVSVFEGTKDVPKDEETFEIWKSLGVPEKRIHFYDVQKNWWSRSGTPDQMPAGEIGGPDSEVFYDFATPHDPKYGRECHPNCDCGRFLEIGNSVFIQYEKQEDGTLRELKQKNVDFGGGLERLAAATNNQPDIFKIDVFKSIIQKLEELSGKGYEGNEKSMRIIADHMRATTFLVADNVRPSNTEHGYVLRRLIRRSVRNARRLGVGQGVLGGIAQVVRAVNTKDFQQVFNEEEKLFQKPLDWVEEYKYDLEIAMGRGIIKKIGDEPILKKAGLASGRYVFENYQTYGVPPDMAQDVVEDLGLKFDEEGFRQAMEAHQEKSRIGAAGKFRGGLADHSEQVVKLHTATHLLHAALRKVLGEHVSQKGSNITSERLRFDFSHPTKLTDEEIKKIEVLVNEQIEKALPVSFEAKTLEEAKEEGALAFFGERYGEKVNVYTIGDPWGGWFSKEVCGGPHVKNTKEIGRVKITKEESAGAGIRRVYATIENGSR